MPSGEGVVLSQTESLCPECLSRIPAFNVAVGQDVYMDKTCPEHGEFRVVIWRGDPSYADWARPKVPVYPSVPGTTIEKRCPFDCGLCPDHRQQTCTALLEITQRCDLRCSYCFADSGNCNYGDPDTSVIRSWYEALVASGHPCNIQLSGGEPTLRDNLPEIVALGRAIGFRFIQLNTNGLRLARDPSFVERLKEAGLASVFLQFDGTDDRIHRALRGGPFLKTKLEAIHNCEQHELGVILVPTLVPGINTNDIGNIIRLALENIRVVRGVHFQPVSYFGRYLLLPSDDVRLTLPELIRNLETQTSGLIKADNFAPPGCENALCSFHGNFVLMPNGNVTSLTQFHHSDACCRPVRAEEGAYKARDFVSEHWSSVPKRQSPKGNTGYSLGEWDILLDRARTHLLCVSGMVFQDAWNVDLERLRDCCIHVVARDGKVVPFCAYNLTTSRGDSLYRRGC
jgi:7,8-dihydro-6-hydroxymethylpterin dimethyltransferase